MLAEPAAARPTSQPEPQCPSHGVGLGAPGRRSAIAFAQSQPPRPEAAAEDDDPIDEEQPAAKHSSLQPSAASWRSVDAAAAAAAGKNLRGMAPPLQPDTLPSSAPEDMVLSPRAVGGRLSLQLSPPGSPQQVSAAGSSPQRPRVGVTLAVQEAAAKPADSGSGSLSMEISLSPSNPSTSAHGGGSQEGGAAAAKHATDVKRRLSLQLSDSSSDGADGPSKDEIESAVEVEPKAAETDAADPLPQLALHLSSSDSRPSQLKQMRLPSQLSQPSSAARQQPDSLPPQRSDDQQQPAPEEAVAAVPEQAASVKTRQTADTAMPDVLPGADGEVEHGDLDDSEAHSPVRSPLAHSVPTHSRCISPAAAGPAAENQHGSGHMQQAVPAPAAPVSTPETPPDVHRPAAAGVDGGGASDIRRNSSAPTVGSTPQQAQRTPLRDPAASTPQQSHVSRVPPPSGIRFALPEGPARRASSPATALTPLRLSPLGSQERAVSAASGPSPQPSVDTWLAEQRAAGLRVFRAVEPAPTQVRSCRLRLVQLCCRNAYIDLRLVQPMALSLLLAQDVAPAVRGGLQPIRADLLTIGKRMAAAGSPVFGHVEIASHADAVTAARRSWLPQRVRAAACASRRENPSTASQRTDRRALCRYLAEYNRSVCPSSLTARQCLLLFSLSLASVTRVILDGSLSTSGYFRVPRRNCTPVLPGAVCGSGVPGANVSGH